MGNGIVFKFLNNIESYICRTLLACFVVLLFAQLLLAPDAVWPQFYDSIGGKEKLDKILAALGRG